MALTRLGTNAITTVSNSAITLDAAEIPNLDASKITTGTLANARIAEASVTQHVTATDLQPVKSDISALALREATNESSAAFNLPNQFIETFTDDTNLGTQTTGDRTDGYWATVYAAGTYTGQTPSAISFGSNAAGNGSNSLARTYDGDSDAVIYYSATGNDSDDNIHAILDLGSTKTIAQMDLGKRRYNGDVRAIKIQYSTSNSGGDTTLLNLTGASSTNLHNNNNACLFSNFTSGGLADWAAITTDQKYAITRITGFTAFDARYIRLTVTDGDWHDNNAAWCEMRMYVEDTSTSATGTLIQSANAVGSAKTKVGGTMLYKDNAGTATLGTDLKIYFTCNGGTNWTEASSYTAITPVYSTGIKQVRLGETTCTSGTDVRYKAVWANQAAGSKETQLHGIGVNY